MNINAEHCESIKSVSTLMPCINFDVMHSFKSFELQIIGNQVLGALPLHESNKAHTSMIGNVSLHILHTK